ncbi:uncharacterized protein [Henckelia pumila]|uniref:uncharacterized protein n=1 Tax=Henckelia pumila TaxID=405737 RepID=UPI003C6DF876
MGSLSHDHDEPNTPSSSQQKTSPHVVVDSSKMLIRSSSTSSSSSSSPDSPLIDDPFGDNDLFTPSNINVSSHIDSKETSNMNQAAAPPKAKANSISVTDAPPTQTMEHINPTTSSSSSSSSSSYRIPSHVFARDKSSTAMDWSVASNESLFSIHTGNMSFTNDHFFWKSGELRILGAGDQMFSYSGVQCGGIKASSTTADTRSCELGIAEATMKEVIRDCENQKNEKSLAQVVESRCVSHRSEGSRTSTKSFAFCTVTGDRDKGVSIGSAASLKSTSQEQSRPHSQQLIITKEPEPSTTGAGEYVATPPPRWFPCMPSCWSLC